MSRKNDVTLLVFSLTAACLWGCGPEAGDDPDEGSLGEANPPIVTHNAIRPADLVPGDIAKKALSPDAWSPVELAGISDPSEAGRWRRTFIEYTVECALGPTDSFSFSWTDSTGYIHEVTYWGEMQLAEPWAHGPLDEVGQQWVSACIAARTNFYGRSVPISVRGAAGTLASRSSEELAVYSHEEGAFWGNLFAAEPKLYSCFAPENVEHSRSDSRECAAGHLEGGQVLPCGIIEITGSCSKQCTPIGTGIYHPACTESANGLPLAEGNEYVITVFLP